MKRIPTRLALCLAVLSILSLRGETAPAKPIPIGVIVSDVVDNRGSATQPGDCRIVLTLSGDAVADAYSVRSIRVTNARDDLGRDLIKTDEAGVKILESVVSNPTPASEQQRLDAVAAEVARRRGAREAAAGQLAAVSTTSARAPLPVSVPTAQPMPRPSIPGRPVISLRNPSRQSAAIKLIEGEIDLITPTETNGGILHLGGITAKPGDFVKNDALEAAGVKLMYLTPETYAAKREAARADARDPSSPWSDEFAGQFRIFTGTPPVRNIVPFFLHDPNRFVVGLELRSKDGKRLDRPVGGINTGRYRSMNLEAPPPADAELIVRVASAGSITTHSFKLENVPLP